MAKSKKTSTPKAPTKSSSVAAAAAALLQEKDHPSPASSPLTENPSSPPVAKTRVRDPDSEERPEVDVGDEGDDEMGGGDDNEGTGAGNDKGKGVDERWRDASRDAEREKDPGMFVSSIIAD